MIGLFDSGHGGLTVLNAVTRRLPSESFVYLGDHANAPYGGRSADEVFALTVANVERLFRQGCGLVLLACNTAAAVALRRLQQEWLPLAYPERRVLGVLVPVVEAVTSVPWQCRAPRAGGAAPARTLGIFATRQTVESGAYPREIRCRAPNVTVLQQACPELAGLIEAAAPQGDIDAVVARHVAALCQQMPRGRPDAVILGCTHFPLVEAAFRRALPPTVEILCQPDLVADSLADYLQRHPEFREQAGRLQVKFLTTGTRAQVNGVAARFSDRSIDYLRID